MDNGGILRDQLDHRLCISVPAHPLIYFMFSRDSILHTASFSSLRCQTFQFTLCKCKRLMPLFR